MTHGKTRIQAPKPATAENSQVPARSRMSNVVSHKLVKAAPMAGAARRPPAPSGQPSRFHRRKWEAGRYSAEQHRNHVEAERRQENGWRITNAAPDRVRSFWIRSCRRIGADWVKLDKSRVPG